MEQHLLQKVCDVALMIQKLDDNDTVFFQMSVKSKASVQNDIKKTRSGVYPNFLRNNEDSR